MMSPFGDRRPQKRISKMEGLNIIFETLDDEKRFVWATSMDHMTVDDWRVMYFDENFLETDFGRTRFYLEFLSIRRTLASVKNSGILFVRFYPTSLWVYYGRVRRDVESFLLKREIE